VPPRRPEPSPRATSWARAPKTRGSVNTFRLGASKLWRSDRSRSTLFHDQHETRAAGAARGRRAMRSTLGKRSMYRISPKLICRNRRRRPAPRPQPARPTSTSRVAEPISTKSWRQLAELAGGKRHDVARGPACVAGRSKRPTMPKSRNPMRPVVQPHQGCRRACRRENRP